MGTSRRSPCAKGRPAPFFAVRRSDPRLTRLLDFGGSPAGLLEPAVRAGFSAGIAMLREARAPAEPAALAVALERGNPECLADLVDGAEDVLLGNLASGESVLRHGLDCETVLLPAVPAVAAPAERWRPADVRGSRAGRLEAARRRRDTALPTAAVRKEAARMVCL